MIDFDFDNENTIRSIAILIILAVGEMIGLLTVGYVLYGLTTEYLVPLIYSRS